MLHFCIIKSERAFALSVVKPSEVIINLSAKQPKGNMLIILHLYILRSVFHKYIKIRNYIIVNLYVPHRSFLLPHFCKQHNKNINICLLSKETTSVDIVSEVDHKVHTR